MNYEEKKAALEAHYRPEAAKNRLAAWLETNPDMAPKVAKKEVKKAPKVEKPAEEAEE